MNWPEPIVRVQSLAESGLRDIPKRYIKRPSERPSLSNNYSDQVEAADIPVIDLRGIFDGGSGGTGEETLRRVSEACRNWGIFQVVNHGVSHELMKEMLEIWREFFQLPVEEKQRYANSPATYEGYGSRLGLEEGAILDWSDYFFLNYCPPSLMDINKWPSVPLSCSLQLEIGR